MPKQQRRKEVMEAFKVTGVLRPTHVAMALALATGGEPRTLLLTFTGQKTGRQVGRIEPVGSLP